jgi:ComF family protein
VPLLAALADTILAPVCLACRGRIGADDAARLVCRRCRSLLRPLPPPLCVRCGAPLLVTGRAADVDCPQCEGWPPALRAARSACLLLGPASTVVHQLKYRGWRALADLMGERMAALRLPEDAQAEATLCVPVPTTPLRRRQRGYNQAELLAATFARCTGRALRPALERRSGGGSQTALQPIARRANVAGAFRVAAAHAAGLRRAHVLLVDDVLTTGATAAECAHTLVAAGARCVTLVTFARALDARRLTT